MTFIRIQPILFAAVLLVPVLTAGTVRGADEEAVADARSLSRAFRSASKTATPSVVTILTYGQNVPQPASEVPGNPVADEAEQNAEGGGEMETDEETLTGLGSGVIVADDGRVITNNHVITGAKKVVIQLSDETRYTATEVRGDPASDVAVLRFDLPRREGEQSIAANFGDSDSMEIGDWVLAIGSPFKLEATVSAGIISAKNRRLSRIARSRLFQTDAAVNPGNSGGALVNLDGQVIGINTAIATRNGGYQGIGFAIPINQARWIADELSEHGQVRRAAIGITMAELNRRIADLFRLEPGLGVLAYEIIGGSAADLAGVQKLDVITEFAGTRVRRPAVLRETIEQLPIGSQQSMKVLRDGVEIELTITLATIEDPTLEE